MKLVILGLYLIITSNAYAKLEARTDKPAKAKIISSDEMNYEIEFEDKTRKKISKSSLKHMKVTPMKTILYVYKK